MKLVRGVILLAILALLAGIGYAAAAVFASNAYPGLSMNTTYNEAYYQKKIDALSKLMMNNPTKPAELKLTDKEIEGALKLVIKDADDLNAIVQGAGIALAKDSLTAQINARIAGNDKGVQVSGQLSAAADGSLQYTVKNIKLGRFPLPVPLSLFAAQKILPPEALQIHGHTIILALVDLPVQFTSIKVDTGILTAGVLLSPERLIQMAAADIIIQKEIVTNLDSLEKGLESNQARAFLDTLQQKKEITAEDAKTALSIYESLSPKDQETLQKNMSSLLQDPAIQELLKKYGVTP